MEEEKNTQSEGEEIVIDGEQAEEVEQSSAQSEKTKKPKKPVNKKQLAVLVLVILAVVSTIAAVMYFVFDIGKQNSSEFDPNVSTAEKKAESTPDDEQLARFIKPTTGETWLSSPEKLSNLNYNTGYGDPKSVEYYKVGMRGENTIIMSTTPCPGSCLYLYEKQPYGTVSVIARPNANVKTNPENENNEYSKDNFTKDVKVDKDVHYDSLSIPDKLPLEPNYELKRQEFQVLGNYKPYVDPDNKPKDTTVKLYGQSTLLKSETSYADTNLTSIGYYIKLPIQTQVYLSYEPLPLSLSGYTYDDGSKPPADDKLKAISRGCSLAEVSVSRADKLTDDDVVKIGKSSDGQVIYEIKDKNSTLISKAYKEFTDFTQDKSMPYYGLKKADFVGKEHGIVIYKDDYGQFLVYIREQLAPTGGCAKPVVYLYPTKDTLVDVKVGADVTVSDPYYNPKAGWQNVLARPSGELTYNGKTYDSLFWEGYGYGDYPSIKSGTVVKTAEAASTIRQQLGQLGLNKKESSDFLEYWVPKLPKEKYTVMSWITTEDMNNLAPLYISPKPDTTIRVFLDFWGSDTQISLPKQSLGSVPRKGFTVVEWGGLTNGVLK